MRSHGRVVMGILVVVGLIAVIAVAIVTDRTSGGNGGAGQADRAMGDTTLASRRISLPENANVLIFGDSYTQGWGATPQDDAWAFHMGQRMGWQVTVNGVGGTGFLNPGSGAGKGNYATRLKKLNAPGPFDLIIVQGGSNDQKLQVDADGKLLDPKLITDAIGEAFEVIAEKYQGTPVILMGPASVATTTNQQKRLMDSLMLQYADAHDIWYISPVRQGWFRTDEQSALVDPATGHPNNLGYVRIADEVQRELNTRILAKPQDPLPSPQAPPVGAIGN